MVGKGGRGCSKPVWKDGSTATTLLLLNNALTVANVGDSRAFLVRFRPSPLSYSRTRSGQRALLQVQGS